MLGQVNQFFGYILTSPLLDQLAEYRAPGKAIGHGRHTGTLTITSPAFGSSVTDSAVQHMLQQLLTSGAKVPQPVPNTLYFVYLPPGVKLIQGGSASCTGFCGYHNDIAGQVFYAAMPYPGCSGCTAGLSPLDALTSTSSHELCEAIADAIGAARVVEQGSEVCVGRDPSRAIAALISLAVLGGVAAKAGGASVLRGSAHVTFWSALAMGVTAGVGAIFWTITA